MNIIEINVKVTKIGMLKVRDVNYISLVVLARYQNSFDYSFTIKN